MKNSCFTCSYHNISCGGSIAGICTVYSEIPATYDPDRAIRNGEPKRMATDLELIFLQLNRIEKQNEEIISLLSDAPISKQEAKYRIEIPDADDIDVDDIDTDYRMQSF